MAAKLINELHKFRRFAITDTFPYGYNSKIAQVSEKAHMKCRRLACVGANQKNFLINTLLMAIDNYANRPKGNNK